MSLDEDLDLLDAESGVNFRVGIGSGGAADDRMTPEQKLALDELLNGLFTDKLRVGERLTSLLDEIMAEHRQFADVGAAILRQPGMLSRLAHQFGMGDAAQIEQPVTFGPGGDDEQLLGAIIMLCVTAWYHRRFGKAFDLPITISEQFRGTV